MRMQRTHFSIRAAAAALAGSRILGGFTARVRAQPSALVAGALLAASPVASPPASGAPLAASPGAFALAAAYQEAGAVQGRVVSATTGHALGFAVVTALDGDGREVARTLANSAGYYLLRVPVGTYRLSVSASGYGTQEARIISVPAAAQLRGVDFSMERQAFELETVVVSVGRTTETAIGAPAHVETLTEARIRSVPRVSLVDPLRDAPGVDLIAQGILSANPVLRGFNNIFSGGLHLIADDRIAGLPSLRANLVGFIPSVDDDVDRIELVFGPGSALYGPNTAHGVLHVITRSPLQERASSLTFTRGERGLSMASTRHSLPIGERLGVRVSGQVLTAREWDHEDPVERGEQLKFASDPGFWREDLMRAAGIEEEEADRWIGRIGEREDRLRRVGAEVRADWAVTGNVTTSLKAGLTHAGEQIELTPLGAAQLRDFRTSYVQARVRGGRFFAQTYLNQADAGGTFLLRNGAPIRDRSRALAVQLQHGIDRGGRHRLSYGVDYFLTDPRSDGTISGAYENEDRTSEVGAYLQSETRLTRWANLVLAGRLDRHSLLPDPIVSPRIALVLEPLSGQALRFTFNRAFTTPTSLNQFIDLGTAIPDPAAAALGYSIRAQGTGGTGFRFRQPDGSYLMRSPFTPAAQGGAAALIPAGGASSYWGAAVQVLAEDAIRRGTPLDPGLLDLLLALRPEPGEIGAGFRDMLSGTSGPLGSLELRDVAPIRESTHSTLEVGYRGLLGGRALVAADAWFSRRRNMVTPITLQTPFVTLEEGDTGRFLLAGLVNAGIPQPEAAALVSVLAPGLSRVPLGVISTPEVHANGAQLLATFTNVGEEISVWGLDLVATFVLGENWSVGGNASFVGDDWFRTEGGQVFPLNAPGRKGSVHLEYRDMDQGRGAELRGRYVAGFPASSGVFEGLACLGGLPEGAEPCVQGHIVVDASASTRIPGLRGLTLQLSAQNVLNRRYRSFPGTPGIGRMVLARIRYDF